MSYKIQTRSVNGWADIKVEDNHGGYTTELFDTTADALIELRDLAKVGGVDMYRIVTDSMPADDDLY
jgi:hypothetical protein